MTRARITRPFDADWDETETGVADERPALTLGNFRTPAIGSDTGEPWLWAIDADGWCRPVPQAHPADADDGNGAAVIACDALPRMFSSPVP